MHFLLVLLFIPSALNAVLSKNGGCYIAINDGDLSEPQPLLLLQNDVTNNIEAFPQPVDAEGTLKFFTNESIDVACPGGSIVIGKTNTGQNVLEATCAFGTQFEINGNREPFSKITCTHLPADTARYSGNKCGRNNDEIEIGFNVNNRFIKLITSCFDKIQQHVLYSTATVTSAIGGNQLGYPRRPFNDGGFYNVKPSTVDKLYTKKMQHRTINTILGLHANDTSVIRFDNDYFLSRGHYIAKAYFVFGLQQLATFYYVNAAPQWQTFNGGNWNTLEGDVRKLADERNLNLEVLTGSHGVSTLPDVNGAQRKLYLFNSKKNKEGIPVPAIFFKVVYDPSNKLGAAFVGINNPYKSDIADDIICKDVCKQLRWLTWQQNNQELGYAYCCNVDDLRKTISYLPHFEVKGLLK